MLAVDSKNPFDFQICLGSQHTHVFRIFGSQLRQFFRTADHFFQGCVIEFVNGSSAYLFAKSRLYRQILVD